MIAMIAPSPISDDRSVDAICFLPFVDFIWFNTTRRRARVLNSPTNLSQLHPAI